jgi:hypothetical protein
MSHSTTLSVALAVHKESIAVAYVPEGFCCKNGG